MTIPYNIVVEKIHALWVLFTLAAQEYQSWAVFFTL